MRHGLAVHFGTKLRILKDQIFGNYAGFNDVAPAIDVFDIGVDRLDPLLESAMQKLPFIGGENTRDDIEGDQPFLSFGIAIDCEGNADTPEHDFSLAPAQIEQIRLDGFQPAESSA